MTIQSGTRLGPYELSSRVGAGGMGEVYRARDTRLDRTVAIKILPSDFALNASLKLRFEREAKTISQLNHPNICVLHDVGEARIGPDENSAPISYLVMEYLEGETLADRIVRGPLPAGDVMKYGIQVAEALHRAHKQGIVHRDLKPGNVMITKSGAKLLDFGLAKGEEPLQPAAAGWTESPTEHRPLTQEGTLLGTFQYMAPEQLEGAPADPRTDIFAFGALLYEMATGKRAFAGKSRTSIIAAIVSSQPTPIAELQPLTPPALQHVIDKCLAKEAEDRWQSAHDIGEELKWISEAGSQAGVATPVVSRRKRREWIAWSIAAIASVAALVAAFFLVREFREPKPAFEAAITPPAGFAFDFSLDSIGSLTVSPDARFVTFSAAKSGESPQLWIRPVDSMDAHPIPGTENGWFPFWAPDSKSIAFFQDGFLKKTDLAGSPPITLCAAPRGRSGGWNREGVIIFSPSAVGEIFRVAASGGKAQPVTTLDATRSETTHRWATFLPDGKHFLYMIGTHSAGVKSDANAVYAGSLDGKTRKFLLNARSNVAYAAGYLLFVREQVLLAQKFDPGKLALSGDPIPIGEHVRYDADYFRAAFATAGDGLLVYESSAADRNVVINAYDRNGTKKATYGAAGLYTNLALSPDSKRLAVTVEDPSSALRHIWVGDLARNVFSRVTFNENMEIAPVWSPDGTRIAYSATTKAWGDLYVKSLAGGAGQLLHQADGEDTVPTSWTPDGRAIVYNLEDIKGQTRGDIMILPLDTRKPVPFLQTPFNESGGKVSPDGKWIAYDSDESGRRAVYLAPFPAGGNKWQVSPAEGYGALWSKGGREIIYSGPGASLLAVDLTWTGGVPQFSAPQKIGDFPAAIAGSVSGDGETLMLAEAPIADVTQPIALMTDFRATVKKKAQE